MKYLILIHSNPRSRALWETLTDEQRMDFGRAHMELSRSLAEQGILVASEGLADHALTTRVTLRDGQPLSTDGPFAEVKEYLAGFLLIDCATHDDAIAIAARVPDAAFNDVELRPVLDMKSVGL